MNDARNPESTGLILDTLAAIDRRTLRMETALFGPPEAPHMGHISRTDVALGEQDERITWVEKKMYLWIGALAVIVWGASHFIR